MNRREFIAGTGVGLGMAAQASQAAEATVSIDTGRELGRVDPMVFGHFLEHLERVVYGGVFDPGSKFADEEGFRADVIDAIKEMGGARVLRWPGGNFVSYYHWKDGIGPRGQRPRRYDVVWKQHESNQFGTDEYLALCRKLGCEPFITVNMGSGTIEEACQWVEYCLHENRKPPVKIWGLGNEHFGPWQVGHYTPQEYARKARQFGQFMRAVSPGIDLVGVGWLDPEWNEALLTECGRDLDWLTIHLYGHRRHLDGVDDFDEITATPALFERDIARMAAQLDDWERRNPRERPIAISLEEWNGRHQKTVPGRRGLQLLRESPRNIVDALFVAGVFHSCLRLARRVRMSNYVFIVNAHGPIHAYPEGIVKTAVFDVFRLFATRLESVSIGAAVKGESYTTATRWEGKPDSATATRIDCAATRSVDSRHLRVSFVNRYKERDAFVKLDLGGWHAKPGGVLHTLTAPALDTINSLSQPDAVRAKSAQLPGPVAHVRLPAHSVCLLELERA